ncbi:hypothetical protein T261_8274 [Streptomyces lydicus]|nr:hypothetical protein T261_8274 [Streptomyces lydicus]
MTDERVERTVEANFEIVEFDESVHDEHGEGPKMSRVTIRKRYQA